jgi:hypothetical protein
MLVKKALMLGISFHLLPFVRQPGILDLLLRLVILVLFRRVLFSGRPSQYARLDQGENLVPFLFPQVNEGWQQRHYDDDKDND